MSIFKSSLRDHKISVENEHRQRLQDIKYWALSFSICITVMIGLILILYFSKDPITSSVTLSELNSSESTQSHSLERKSSQPPLILIREQSTGTLSYIDQFRDIYVFLFHKLHNNKDHEFTSAVLEYAERFSRETLKTYTKMNKYKEIINPYLNVKSTNPHVAFDITITDYNKVFYEYAKMINLAYQSLEQSELYFLIAIEDSNTLNMIDYRMIYQELPLKLILKTITQINRAFRNIIEESVKARLKIGGLYEFCVHFNTYIQNNKENMFVINENKTGLKYKEQIVDFEFLLRSFEEYRRLLVLNLYIIFMHVFEMNENYEIINSTKYFLDEFVEDKENFKDDILLSVCEDVFLYAINATNMKEFYDYEKGKYEQCRACLLGGKCSGLI
eukprot:GAHX01001699.1.p1 GENE.GAHX01001699.1~~GAHX01001699.1.p1  ORF type:complete len:389 (-),score=50.44 GAHX01001699.1:113-1279(-)